MQAQQFQEEQKAKHKKELESQATEKLSSKINETHVKVQKSVDFLDTSKCIMEENKSNIQEAHEKIDVLTRMLKDKIVHMKEEQK